ncbi:hypothetical protein M0L70_RS18415 [Providencia rettgeri]|nr:hypothetical protein [Providencia rettgeri]
MLKILLSNLYPSVSIDSHKKQDNLKLSCFLWLVLISHTDIKIKSHKPKDKAYNVTDSDGRLVFYW